MAQGVDVQIGRDRSDRYRDRRRDDYKVIELKPDAILVAGRRAVSVLRQQTRSIPIVLAGISDPAGQARPSARSVGLPRTGREPVVIWQRRGKRKITAITPCCFTARSLQSAIASRYALEIFSSGMNSLGDRVRALSSSLHSPHGAAAYRPFGGCGKKWRSTLWTS